MSATGDGGGCGCGSQVCVVGSLGTPLRGGGGKSVSGDRSGVGVMPDPLGPALGVGVATPCPKTLVKTGMSLCVKTGMSLCLFIHVSMSLYVYVYVSMVCRCVS